MKNKQKIIKIINNTNNISRFKHLTNNQIIETNKKDNTSFFNINKTIEKENTFINKEIINNNINNAFFYAQLSGRLRGVSMAKNFKYFGSASPSLLLNSSNKFNNDTKKGLEKHIIISNIKNKNVGLKPQTFDTCIYITNEGSYRLQYIHQDIFTK